MKATCPEPDCPLCAAGWEYAPDSNHQLVMKSRPDLFPARALLLGGDVLAFGEMKHPNEPWKQMSVADHLGAVMRHTLKWQSGEKLDTETGKSHLVHALVRMAMAVDREATSSSDSA